MMLNKSNHVNFLSNHHRKYVCFDREMQHMLNPVVGCDEARKYSHLKMKISGTLCVRAVIYT